MEDNGVEYSFKILLVGDAGVGKTNIIQRFSKDSYSEDCKATIGVDLVVKSIMLKDKKINLKIWDTSGTERYRSINRSFYRGAHGAFCVYAVNDKKSFLNMPSWIDDVKKNSSDKCVIMLVGAKSDIADPDRQVSLEEGAGLAQAQNISFFETSAKQAANITSTFETISEKILQLAEEDPEFLGKFNKTNPNNASSGNLNASLNTNEKGSSVGLSPSKDIFIVQGSGGQNGPIVDLAAEEKKQNKAKNNSNGCC